MKVYYDLKNKVDRTKEQVASIETILHDLRQKAFVTEEILWDLKRNLETAQRDLLVSLKGLGEDEVLAVRSGLTLEEIKRGKVLLGSFAGKAGKVMKEALAAKGPSHGLGEAHLIANTRQEEAKSE